MNLCPDCLHSNPAHANFCGACGALLVARARSAPRSEPPEAALLPELQLSDALWHEVPLPARLGDRLGPQAAETDALEAWHIIELDAPSLGPEPDSALVNWVRSDPDQDVASFIERRDTEARDRAEPEPKTSPSLPPAVTKAARRAAVRRTRLARTQAESRTHARTPAVPADVLVLDRAQASREPLCRMLESFGFRVHSALGLAQAGDLLDTRHYAAAFLDVVFDGSDQGRGLELCERVKQAPATQGAKPSALIILSDQPRPMDRVRAALAGSEGFLVKPASRGEVVRALEACGVPLPADARRL